MHVTSIGVDMVGKCELSDSLIDTADVVMVDDVVVSQEVGILQRGGRRGENDRFPISIGDVLNERHPGRTTEQQITVAGLSGLGVQDAAIAELVMQRLAK